MNPTNIDREIDRKCAELMGWHLHERADGDFWYKVPYHAPDWYSITDCVIAVKDWHPSIGIAQAMEVEEQIRELQYAHPQKPIIDKYVTELINLTRMGEGYPNDYFRIIHATPEQRCLAALKAIGRRNDGKTNR
jgi:hypothetical protein